MAEPRRSRSFWPTVLVGLAGATLASVAGGRDWAQASGRSAGVDVAAASKGSESAPLVVALALVALAGWGVVLVVRARARRVVSVVGALASAGVVAATLAAVDRAQDDAVRAVVGKGAAGDGLSASLTGWYYSAAAGGALTTVAFGLAVMLASTWPSMGSRYDAPATRAEADDVGAQDMWRALDDGRDPTS